MSETSEAPRTNWVAITVGVLGGALLLGAVGTAAIAGLFVAASGSSGEPQHLSSDADGVTMLSVDAVAAKFSVSCEGSADRPNSFELTTDSGERQWRMSESRGHLRVEPDEPWTGLNFGGAVNRGQNVVLGLPATVCDGISLLDADLELGAGKLLVDGNYGELDAQVEAGDFEFTGEAREFDLEVSAGSADFVVHNVRDASITVAAGKVKGEFAGSAPTLLQAELSAGHAVLLLPDVEYSVRSDVSAGGFENGLRTVSGAAAHEVKVDVSAGHLSVQPTR